MKTIKRLDPLSMGKVYAILMALMQLIVGILMLVGGGVISKYMGTAGIGGAAAAGGVVALIMGVITGLILGFIIGVIGAWLYNLVAKWVGGIKIVLE